MEEEEKEEEREEGNSSNPPPLSLPEYIHVLWHLYAISAIKSLYRKVPLESLFFKAFLPNNLHFPSTTLKPPVSSLQKKKNARMELFPRPGFHFRNPERAFSHITQQWQPACCPQVRNTLPCSLFQLWACICCCAPLPHSPAFFFLLFFFFFLHSRSHQTNRKGLAFHLLPGNISTR